ncbi:MAG: hypothetical protein B6I30_10610, partial [Desulfobacteraceae bacterium 4572_187]
MFVSSTTGEEAVKRVIETPQSLQKTEFPHILKKQIADPVQPAHTTVSARGSQIGNKTSIAPSRFFLNTITVSDYYPPVSNHSIKHPAHGKGYGNIPYPKLDSDPPDLTNGLQTGRKSSQGPELVQIGTLSKSDPTVSELLIKHPAYGKNCWNILSSGINSDKNYTTIPGGSSIYLNPETIEISWNNPKAPGNDTPASAVPGIGTQSKNNTPKNAEPVLLGTLSKSDPTVSELLIKHPAYGKNCWGILSSGINSDKAYTTIPDGSRVYLNPKTLEVVWNENKRSTERVVEADPPDLRAEQIQLGESNPFSAGLVEAVKPYMGKPYKEMNCFELVAKGLEGVGIRYYGRNGLGERLVKMATQKGLSSNHYLSGEGLIETSGSPIYSKSIPKIRNSKSEASKVYQEVKPFLHKGLILSFSTPTRGHTGIVSQRGQNWTYINSGHMDHRLEGRASRGVGE